MLNPKPSLYSLRPIASLFNLCKAQANQWRDPEKLVAIQNGKLKSIVQTAYQNVSYYRRLFDECNLSPASIQTIGDLEKIPITTKADLQRCAEEEILNKLFAIETLTSEHSSGSMGQPFRVYYDPLYRSVRNMLFLRGLIAVGYRIGHKVLLVTEPGKKNKSFLRWYYSSILNPPERLITELNREKPDLLYGCKTSLVSMAEFVRDTRIRVHCPKRIVSTAEILNPESRALLERVFSAKVFDFYGSTEMGLVGWECKPGEGYHLSVDSVIVEFLPIPENSGLSRMVMTNLDLNAMPLIRYESGDLGLPGPLERCPCGRGLPRLQRVEGRQNDCLKMRDGRKISPYRLTCAIEKIAGILKYQVIQTDWDDFTVRIRLAGKDETLISALIQETLHSILGAEIRLKLDYGAPLKARAGSKFRVVESMQQPQIMS